MHPPHTTSQARQIIAHPLVSQQGLEVGDQLPMRLAGGDSWRSYSSHARWLPGYVPCLRSDREAAWPPRLMQAIGE